MLLIQMSIQRKIINFPFRLVIGVLGIALIANGRTLCAQSPIESTKIVTPDSAFDALADEYQQWRDFSFPESAIAHGRPTSPDRITEPGMRGALNRHNEIGYFIEKIASIDRAQLNSANQLDYDLLNRDLRNDFDSFRFKRWMMPVGQRGGPQQDLPQFGESVPFRQAADWENYVKRLTRLGAAVRDTQSMMEQGLEEGIVPPAAVLEGVIGQFESVLRGNLNEIETPLAHMPDSIPAAQQQSLREQARTAKLDALLALGEMLTWLKETYIPKGLKSISAKDQYLGTEYYAFELKRFTTTDLTPEEIHRIGLDEVARIRGEMLEVIARTDWFAADPARAKLSNDDRFNAFVEFLRSDPRFYHTSAESLLAGYRDVCKRIDAKLPEYFGVLPRLPYGVREIPRFMAPSQTTAYYQFGSMKAGLPGWFYANTYALDQRPKYEMIPLSLHEAVPGHHLQVSIANEVDGLREFRRDVDATAFVEGWALYAERLGISMGLYENPYDDFGRLLYEMWRACRLVVDTGMHAFGMSRDDAIAFLQRNTALSRLNIEREIDRYIGWPGQACGYKIGELEIRRIRSECEKRLGERFDLRAFHDHLLSAGPIPLNVLRTRMDAWCDGLLLQKGVAQPLAPNGG
ncbi:MAG: DUF885 domain-containing protein [Phycisphaerales bacterium]